MSTETQQPHELDKFQVWWNYHGQYCRAGGGEYEESFAWAAWQAAQAPKAAELAALKAENEVLRKDAARIDHVESHGGDGLGLSKNPNGTWWAMPYKKLSATRFPNLRAAIDSTMQTKEAS